MLRTLCSAASRVIRTLERLKVSLTILSTLHDYKVRTFPADAHPNNIGDISMAGIVRSLVASELSFGVNHVVGHIGIKQESAEIHNTLGRLVIRIFIHTLWKKLGIKVLVIPNRVYKAR
jgi:hypothetical protein